ncbi:hypothetical protein PoB_007374200 [Plakobranchus ocellatus]|uniref:Uncharacterized protein n=1 Tax=Plakobranchus ocellatus TaxID=259542 RepID=A0AAV4DSE0_9GAST|nr:hypothetical protein PoB_007374200 [Plakobranchus ocellatus]
MRCKCSSAGLHRMDARSITPHATCNLSVSHMSMSFLIKCPVYVQTLIAATRESCEIIIQAYIVSEESTSIIVARGLNAKTSPLIRATRVAAITQPNQQLKLCTGTFSQLEVSCNTSFYQEYRKRKAATAKYIHVGTKYIC